MQRDTWIYSLCIVWMSAALMWVRVQGLPALPAPPQLPVEPGEAAGKAAKPALPRPSYSSKPVLNAMPQPAEVSHRY